jgi:hypothetical protein
VATRDLCTLTDVCKLVPGYTAGTDTGTDATLNELITEQSRDAMEACGREFTPVEATQPALRAFDITETVYRTRKLRIGDMAAAPTSLDLYNVDGTLAQSLTSSSYVLLPRVREDWQPYSTVWFRWDASVAATLWGMDGWWRGGGLEARINATWGFPSVPTTVKDAVARLVIVRYLNDAASVGTQFADAADRVSFNIAGSVRQALDALDRFHVPTI